MSGSLVYLLVVFGFVLVVYFFEAAGYGDETNYGAAAVSTVGAAIAILFLTFVAGGVWALVLGS